MKDAIIGSLLGTAVGDALGLPMEGMSKRRQGRIYPEIRGYHLLFGKGMVSDDTEHTCIVAGALISSAGEARLFTQHLKWLMKKWLIALPAGVGLATLRSLLKLWIGFSAQKSGVFSAGNGPAMRCAIIGVCFGDNRNRLKELVRISTRITHTDPKAEYGSLAVALAAFMASRHEDEPSSFLQILGSVLGEGALDDSAEEFLGLISRAVDSTKEGHSTETFAARLGLEKGISGYIYHTVPVLIHAWFRHPRDLKPALLEAIKCGGDTDTVAAILGGIVGAAVGKEGIPQEMRSNLRDWPLTLQYLESLGEKLYEVVSEGNPQNAPSIPFIGSLLRNLFFMCIVLIHGFRRLLPPY